MNKVIKLEAEGVVIATSEHGNIRALYEWLNFNPSVGDIVDIYEDGEELIIHKTTFSENPRVEDKIHINIVNENSQQQFNSNNNGYVQSGKVVNKWLYVIVALFLGGLGAHKFLVGKIGSGIVYLLFCWTAIPSIIAFFSAISAAFKPADRNGNIVI